MAGQPTVRSLRAAGTPEHRVSAPLPLVGRRRASLVRSLALPTLLLGVALLAPALAPDDPLRVDLARAGLPPSLGHLMGTDRLGREVLSRWLYGGRTTLLVAGAAAAFGCSLGGLLGAIAGFRGGILGALIDRLVDVSLALPAFFLAVAFQAALPPGALSVIAVISLTAWMGPARTVRAEVLRLRRLAYVEAARALGCSWSRTLFRHVLPHCAGTFAAVLTAGFGDAVLLQSTLSFLGLGIPPPAPSWGGMLLEAMPELLHGAWWLLLVPGLSILLVTAAVGEGADGLRSHR